MIVSTRFVLTVLVAAASASVTSAQAPGNPAALIAAQKAAMAPLAMMDGVWRGPTSTMGSDGKNHEITQTERVGPFLDESVKVLEGRGYSADGSVAFNALGVISYDPATKTYAMRAYAQGHVGDFTLQVTSDGFTWEVPEGPVTMRYTAVIKDGTWHEVGDTIMKGAPPVRVLDMNLKRVGDTTWPAGGAVPMK